jgi:hypothetical protein
MAVARQMLDTLRSQTRMEQALFVKVSHIGAETEQWDEESTWTTLQLRRLTSIFKMPFKVSCA